jgi:hypothetical protein
MALRIKRIIFQAFLDNFYKYLLRFYSEDLYIFAADHFIAIYITQTFQAKNVEATPV